MVGIVDNRTPNLDLPLADLENVQIVDVPRINAAFEKLDTLIPKKADLTDGGKVKTGQLPDDGYVLPYANKAAFPAQGIEGRIYIDVADKERPYRWTAGGYKEVNKVPGSTDDLNEGSTNRYFTAQRARDAIPIAGTAQPGVVKVGPGLIMASDGTLSAVTGSSGQTVPAFTEQIIVPSVAGQTEFTVAYAPGTIELLLNGVTLYGNGDDYTASDGAKIVLTAGVNPSDTLLLRRWVTTGNLPFSALTDRPTTVGGYGINDAITKAGGVMTGALDLAAFINVASAPVMDLAAVKSNHVYLTGSATITDLGTPPVSGMFRRVLCDASPKFSHNTKIWMPGSRDYQGSLGDVLEFVSQSVSSSSIWRCTAITPARGIHDIVRTDDAQVLKNKSFANVKEAVPAVFSATGTFALEPNTCSLARVSVVGNTTVTIRAPTQDGEQQTIVFIRGAAGVTLSFGSNIRFDEDKPPTLPAAVGRALTIGLLSMNGLWMAFVGGVSHNLA